MEVIFSFLKELLKPIAVMVIGAITQFLSAASELFINAITELAADIKAEILNARIDSLYETLLKRAVA